MKLSAQLHRLRYFCSDAWDEWRHSSAVNLMALVTLTAALFLAGLVMLTIANVDHRVQGLRDDIRVDVYLQEGHGEDQRAALIAELEGLDDVARVEYVDKERALERYREWAADMAELVPELETNPLPASLEVYLVSGATSAERADRIAGRLADNAAVEEVRFSQEWLRRLESVVGLARIGGSVLALLVFAAVVFVMASVLRLAVYARREEIGIMQLVGATPGFIRGPFLVAGAAQGLIASIAALLIAEGLRQLILASAGSGGAIFVELVAANPLPRDLSALLVLVGLLVSLTSSYFAVRQPA